MLIYCLRGLQQLVFQPLPQATRVVTYDFGVYLRAARALNAGFDPYRLSLTGCHGRVEICGYNYPLLLAEMLRPVAPLGDLVAARLWLILTQACVLTTTVLLYRSLPKLRNTGGWMLLAGAMLFLPLYQSLYSLQVGAALTLLVTIAATAVQTRPLTAGIALGAAAVLRVTPVVILPALLRRAREMRSAVAMVATCVLLLTLLAAASPYALEYFTQVLPALGAAPPLLDNQSVPGFWARAGSLAGGGAIPWARGVALLSVVAILAITWGMSLRTARKRPDMASVAAFIAAMPLVSTLTWQHHLVTELPVMAILLGLSSRPRRTGALLVAAYPFLWVDRHVTDPLAQGLGLMPPGSWTALPFLIITSLNLVGMLVVWMAALQVLKQLEGSVIPPAALLSAVE